MTVARTVLITSAIGEYRAHIHLNGVGTGFQKSRGIIKLREQAGSHDKRNTYLKHVILHQPAFQPVLALFAEVPYMKFKKTVKIFPCFPVKRRILKHEHTVHKRKRTPCDLHIPPYHVGFQVRYIAVKRLIRICSVPLPHDLQPLIRPFPVTGAEKFLCKRDRHIQPCRPYLPLVFRRELRKTFSKCERTLPVELSVKRKNIKELP